MSEFKQLGKISVITDTEYSYEIIGEVQGGSDDAELKKHIEKYGAKSLIETLTYMQWRVWQTLRDINQEVGNKNVSAN